MTGEDLDLLEELVREANDRTDGHLTIMKFTTNWRVMFGTPTEREDIEDHATIGHSFHEAGHMALLQLRRPGYRPLRR